MKKVILILSVVIIALFACACSSGSAKSEASSLPDITAEVTPKPTKEPVKTVEIAIVNTDGVNVRADCDTASEVYTQAYLNEAFLLVKKDVKEGWNQIKYNGKDAYISSEFTTIESMTEAEAAKKLGAEENSPEPETTSTPAPNAETTESTDSSPSGTVKSGETRGNEDGQKR